jgi:hypothetical protein
MTCKIVESTFVTSMASSATQIWGSPYWDEQHVATRPRCSSPPMRWRFGLKPPAENFAVSLA